MKRNLQKIALTILALILIIAFGMILLLYTKPMEDVSLNLSLLIDDTFEEMTEETYDNKGWSIYTQEGTIKKTLEPNYYGAYY